MTKRYDYKTQQWVEDGMPEPYTAPPQDWAMDPKYPNPTEPVDLPKWPGGPATDASPSASSNEPKVMNVTEQNKEVNIEDPSMLDRIFKALAGKVVEASDLAKRVAELEAKVHNLEVALSDAKGNAETERLSRLAVERDMADIRQKLDHEQRAVHDLIVERDMERDAKGQAQASLAQAQQDCNFWTNEAQRLEREKGEAVHASDVCREQREQMAKQVAALREAFGALRVIG